MLNELDAFLATSTARLVALLKDQERLLEVIRKEKPELVRSDPPAPSTLPPAIQSR
jgi:hypothetical protein